MNAENPKALLERLLRERAELEQRRASTLEQRAEIRARGRSGPVVGPEGSHQSRYIYEMQKALAELASQDKGELATLDQRISAVRATLDANQTKEQLTDKAQEEAIEKALSTEFNKAAQTPGPTKDFNRLASLTEGPNQPSERDRD